MLGESLMVNECVSKAKHFPNNFIESRGLLISCSIMDKALRGFKVAKVSFIDKFCCAWHLENSFFFFPIPFAICIVYMGCASGTKSA